jgi:hypothetical protein
VNTKYLLLLLPLAACGPTTSTPGTGPVSWHKDVQPILQKRCQGCHVEGGIGLFPLETYDQAKLRHASMANAVANRTMPPWMPSPDCQTFKESRRLDQSEIDVLVAWSEQNTPEGNAADAKPAPAAPAGLPWVDATLQPVAAYTPSSAVTDDYRCLVLDPGLSQDRDLIGFEILPQARQLVHHVILYTADPADAAAQDAAEAGQGWTCYGGPGTPNPQMVGGWVPGSAATQYPQDTGITIKAGKVIVMQVHYNMSNGGPAPDQSTVKLQFSQQRVTRPALITLMAQASFAIPPNAVGYSATATISTPVINAKLWGVIPHMHTKGKKLKVTLENQCLIDIPAWDFHWQQFYFYETPVSLTPGKSAALTCTWDNPTSNVVTWGEGTDDEMCLNYFYLTL